MKYYIEFEVNKNKTYIKSFSTLQEAEKWYKENVFTDATIVNDNYEFVKCLTKEEIKKWLCVHKTALTGKI